MNTSFKKLAAALSAATIALTLSGCMDNGSLMTVDGTTIRNGVYINYMVDSTNEAQSKVSAESSDTSAESENSDSGEKFWNSTIDGKDVSEWIKDNTLKNVRSHIGVQRLCGQFGIALTDEELTEINSQCDKRWDTVDIYAKYIYGFETFGDMYEARGISIDSYKEITRVSMLRDKLFEHYYGEGGEYAVPETDYNNFVNENYAAIRVMELPYTDYSGEALEGEAEIQKVKDKAKEYAQQLNDGEHYEVVRYHYELSKAQDTARKNAKAQYTEDNADGLTLEEYIEKAAADATYSVPDDASTYNRLYDKAEPSYGDDVTDFILSLARDGKAYVFDSDEAKTSYVVVRLEMSELENWDEQNHETVLRNMRNDEFEELVDKAAAGYEIHQDDYLVNTKYTPKKVDAYVQPAN